MSAAAHRNVEHPRTDEDFDTGVYPTATGPEPHLEEIIRRAEAALAGSPGIPNDVVWARWAQRWPRIG